jgi:hypothetical protein
VVEPLGMKLHVCLWYETNIESMHKDSTATNMTHDNFGSCFNGRLPFSPYTSHNEFSTVQLQRIYHLTHLKHARNSHTTTLHVLNNRSHLIFSLLHYLFRIDQPLLFFISFSRLHRHVRLSLLDSTIHY